MIKVLNGSLFDWVVVNKLFSKLIDIRFYFVNFNRFLLRKLLGMKLTSIILMYFKESTRYLSTF